MGWRCVTAGTEPLRTPNSPSDSSAFPGGLGSILATEFADQLRLSFGALGGDCWFCNVLVKFSAVSAYSAVETSSNGRRIAMPKKTITFDTVQEIGLALPGAEEGTSYGVRSLKVGGKMFACPAINKSAEPGTLGIRIPFEQRDELLEADPDTYYITDHYVNYPSVLVRLSRVDRDALQDLLRMAWQYVSAMSKRPVRKGKTSASRGGQRAAQSATKTRQHKIR